MKNKILIFLLQLFAYLTFSSGAVAQDFKEKSINDIVALTCKKQILLFGEAAHSDGATLEFKSRIIPTLINECGYKAIIFEAPIYDFLELSRITKPTENYDKFLFLSAWGGMWNQYKEASIFAEFISTKAPNDLKIFGMDNQNASRGAFYTIYEMPIRLSNVINDPIQSEKCKKLLDPMNRNWVDDTPNVKPTDECLSKIMAILSKNNDKVSKHLFKIAKSDRKANQYIGMPTDLMSDTRDIDMANNIIDFYKKMPKNSKIIVWTANSHASFGGLYKGHSVGQVLQAKYKSKVFSVGVTAASGKLAYHNDKIPEFINPKPESLEAHYKNGYEITILKKENLTKIGKVEGQVLLAHEFQTQDWSKLFDAILILKEEWPANHISNEWIEWKDKSKKYNSYKANIISYNK